MSGARAAVLLEFEHDRRRLAQAFVIGLVIEALLLTLFGWNGHWLAHPQSRADDAGFIEAQIFEVPPETHLVEQKAAAVPLHEKVLSRVVHQGREEKPEEKQNDEQNQTDSGPPAPPTHGPLAIFSPPPHIPSYLQDQDLHASVVIDFLVTALGHSTPHLVGSSGNEELDAIALEAAQKWQFRPAEKDHKAIDAKVRLRLEFEVK